MTTHAYQWDEFTAKWPTATGPLGQYRGARPAGDMLIIAVEADDTLLAYWPIWTTVHLDGLWVDPDARQHAGVLRSLLEGVSATLRENAVQGAFAVLDMPEHQAMAERLGFVEIPGRLYMRRGD